MCLILKGLADSNNYHEFCRLLARLKSNYQLGELVMVDSYQETVGLIAKFTVESLQVIFKLTIHNTTIFFFFCKCLIN